MDYKIGDTVYVKPGKFSNPLIVSRADNIEYFKRWLTGWTPSKPMTVTSVDHDSVYVDFNGNSINCYKERITKSGFQAKVLDITKHEPNL